MTYDETSRAVFEARARAMAEWPARARSIGIRTTPHLLFRVHGERLALPLTAVRAYVRSPEIARFPSAQHRASPSSNDPPHLIWLIHFIVRHAATMSSTLG